MSGHTLQIHCVNFFNVCKYCSPLIVAPLSKNSTNKIASLFQTWHCGWLTTVRLATLLLIGQTHHSLPTTCVHNIHHLALLWHSTHVTEWSTNNPGAAGQCHYLVGKAKNSNWHHIKKEALLSYQPSYVTKLAYWICVILSNLWGSGQEYFWKNYNWSRQTMYTELVQCCRISINSSALLTHWRGQ